jgi:hypothetical protein
MKGTLQTTNEMENIDEKVRTVEQIINIIRLKTSRETRHMSTKIRSVISSSNNSKRKERNEQT